MVLPSIACQGYDQGSRRKKKDSSWSIEWKKEGGVGAFAWRADASLAERVHLWTANTHRTHKMVSGSLFRAFLALLACASLTVASRLRAGIPTDDMPLHVDAVTCDMAECEPMCVCQKLLWSIDFRHPLSLGPGDNHCTHWRKSGALPDSDTCSSACSTLVQHVEAAAGRDPHVCLRAVKEVMALSKDASD